MSFLQNLDQAVTKLDTHADPAVQTAAASGRQFIADLKAALPQLAVDGVNALLTTVPFGGLISKFLDPVVAGGVAVAESVAMPLVEHWLGLDAPVVSAAVIIAPPGEEPDT